MPWRLTSHGTIVSSRASRAVAVSCVIRPSAPTPVRGQGAPQPPHDRVDELGWLLDDDVGAVAGELLGEVLEVLV